ncbi:hypothetical protein QBC35DRAFT_464390 [Podospora australis]|uniref:chitinase n=1 Tax=Podospora australis TaxID=1536484 RepID=A0AAN7AID7_9PEZI|nr:hypothetical protein QBC35DRAFT_464390 [Podospora australis]
MRLSAACVVLFALCIAAQDADNLVLEGVDDGTNYYQQLHPCPLACDGSPSSEWIMYSSWERFAVCNEPLLLSFALSNPVLDSNTPTKITTCTAGNAESNVNALFITGTNDAATSATIRSGSNSSRSARVKRQPSTACEAATARASATKSKTSLQLVFSETTDPDLDDKRFNAASTALQTLQEHFVSGDSPCEENVMFAYHQGVVAGVFIGASFGRDMMASIAKPLLNEIQSTQVTSVAAQLCGAPERNARHTFGLVVDVSGNITAVQEAVRGWNEARCLTSLPFESISKLIDVEVVEDKTGLAPFKTTVPETNGTVSSSNNHTTLSTHQLAARADCRIIRAEFGDTCETLAVRCGITPATFTKFNSKPSDLCANIYKGTPVCCSAGTFPDIIPKKNSDGTCAKHRVVADDTCKTLAAYNRITVDDIEDWNKDAGTWGWYDCDKLLIDTYICLSAGKAPLPFPQKGAVCGPTKEDSKLPEGDKELKDLNPCPLNACCNVWGQCGISGDFCTEKKSSSGNPGTSGLRNGCVSSCGMDIVNKGPEVKPFGRIGYYETWNFNRECLWQHIENSNTDGTYNIIHWAFAEIDTKDWTVKIVDQFNQWEKFKEGEAGKVQRVISFGGWGYSTEPETYDILRQAMSPANRNTFAKNVAKFLDTEGLEGVDFDWEYPGNTDIEGAEGNPADVGNYLKFLTIMKSELAGTGRTLSIAAPASFWYLKPFPIKQMAVLLDYIVFMTYDLHGQWDAGNEHAIDGCPAGNCVRSHVNLTETTWTLSMITKAGVPPSKIYVGESSYGRSFKLAQANCEGFQCVFLGDRKDSQAAPGRCTGQGGYIANAEIDEIIKLSGPNQIKSFHDHASNSDILVYGDGTEWVAYMTPTTKRTRRDHWKSMGFAGTIDWATDLQAFTIDEQRGPDDEIFEEELPSGLSDCKGGPYKSVEAVQEDTKIPEHCRPVYMAEVLSNTITESMKQYETLINKGYDGKFNTYAEAVVKGGDSAVREFMNDNGNKYFTCKVQELVDCCAHCEYYKGDDNGKCRYCSSKTCGNWQPSCGNSWWEGDCSYDWEFITVEPECPPDYSKRAGRKPADGWQQSIDWKFQESKKKDFWADLYTAVGIEENDIKFTDVERRPCAMGEKECKNMNWDFNFPVTEGFEKDDVLNPKDVVEDAYKELQGFVKDLPKAVAQMKENKYDASAFDLVDAIALPIFMVEQAVSVIKEIADKVDEWNRKKRENIILLFLSAIFFFVPVLGQLAGTIASLANVARILITVGTAGSVALDIYNVVNSEGNDPLDIFGLVLAPLAIFDGVQMARAATRARAMKQDDVRKLGGNLGSKMTAIRKTTAPFCTIKSKRDVNVFADAGLPVSDALSLRWEQPFGSLSL